MMGKREDKATPSQREIRSGTINVRVIDEANGYQQLENVRAIRINSKDYRLLILDNFADTLGRIEGNVVFILADHDVELKSICGYYKHQHNEFTLLVQEDRNGWSERL